MEIVTAEIEIVMVEDLLLPPGRYGRPSKIVVILRGLPGSGKSHLARSIKVLFQLLLLFRLNFKI
jgi:ABC-type proline/glycine betaine transport system ATPase subunit